MAQVVGDTTAVFHKTTGDTKSLPEFIASLKQRAVTVSALGSSWLSFSKARGDDRQCFISELESSVAEEVKFGFLPNLEKEPSVKSLRKV